VALGSERSEGNARADRPASGAEILGSLLTPPFGSPMGADTGPVPEARGCQTDPVAALIADQFVADDRHDGFDARYFRGMLAVSGGIGPRFDNCASLNFDQATGEPTVLAARSARQELTTG